MKDVGRPCVECDRFESCVNPAKETRGRNYIGCANNAPVVLGEVSDIITGMMEEINRQLEGTGYVLVDMFLAGDRESLLVRFAPDPFADEEEVQDECSALSGV